MAKKVYVGAENFTKRDLPSGYTQVEYIESSGTQYIDTGFTPNQDTRVVMDVQLTTYTSSTNQWLFCGRTATKNSAVGFFHYQNLFGACYGSEQSMSISSMDALTRLLIDSNKNNLVFNEVAYSFSEQTFTSGGNLVLLARNSNGTVDMFASARLYSCKVYDSGNLIRDYVPCINSDGTVGLYDMVNGLFYGNAGTGAFTAGNGYKTDVAREVKKIYLGAEGVAREIQKGYVGVNGVARRFWLNGTPIGELDVGNTIWMNVNGTAREFIIVNQGIPSDSSMYDSSCDGTWLLLKDLYTKMVWDSTDNDYENSDIHAYLCETFLSLLDSDIQAIVKQVKIPYQKGNGSSESVSSGVNGLTAKIFLLSGYECGFTKSDDSVFPEDGACLDYFTVNGGNDTKRVAYYNGEAWHWALRTPKLKTTAYLWHVNMYGSYQYHGRSNTDYVRPALILPSDTLVDENMNVLAD